MCGKAIVTKSKPGKSGNVKPWNIGIEKLGYERDVGTN